MWGGYEAVIRTGLLRTLITGSSQLVEQRASAMAALLNASAWSEWQRQKRTIPKYASDATWGEVRPDGQASGGRLDYRAQAPPPDAIWMTQTCRQTSGFERRSSDPERARPRRCADDSDATNPRPIAAPDRIRRAA